jgi:predicted RecA/RadA family phage recombinase
VDGSEVLRIIDRLGYTVQSVFFERKSKSEHIEIATLPSAVAKGDVVVLGGLVGVADYTAGAGFQGSVNVGKPVSVYQVGTGDMAEAPGVGALLYLDMAGLTLTPEGSVAPVGTVVAVYGTTADVVRLW